jgi:hypothetical protein
MVVETVPTKTISPLFSGILSPLSIILSSSFGGIPARPLTPERSACSTLALARGEMAEICQQQC